MRPVLFIAVVNLVLASLLFGQAQPAPTTRLVGEMLRPTGPSASIIDPVVEPPTMDTMMGRNAIPATQATNMVKEGSYIVNRVGRLARNSEGQWEFTFDPLDANSVESTVILLPNRSLAAMENAIATSARPPKFRITGTVTEYKYRNYVLVDRVQRVE